MTCNDCVHHGHDEMSGVDWETFYCVCEVASSFHEATIDYDDIHDGDAADCAAFEQKS